MLASLSLHVASASVYGAVPASAGSVPRHVVIEVDHPKEYGDPRQTLARIQSDMERLAAGQPRWPVPEGATRHPMEALVDAYAAFLANDDRAMDASLSVITAVVMAKPASSAGAIPRKTLNQDKHDYDAVLAATANSPQPLLRLFAGLRMADAALNRQMSRGTLAGGGMPDRKLSLGWSYAPSQLSDTWLRLPCRTVIGRTEQFEQARAVLARLLGPQLSCPSAGNETLDYVTLEQSAKHPDRFKPRTIARVLPKDSSGIEPPPTGPWNRATAIANMGRNPGKAAPVLERASHQDTLGKLDYALFLHAFRPVGARRNALIQSLLAEVLEQAQQKWNGGGPLAQSEFPPQRYDGTDRSLLNTIIQASQTGAANSSSAYYSIPCAVLLARPALVAATQAQYGSNRDNFLPRPGCNGERGSARGFPQAAVNAFKAASTAADGDFINNFQGSLKYGLGASQNAIYAAMQVDPRSFLTKQEPTFAYPYQIWGYTSLGNYEVAQQLRGKYRQAQRQLAAYYARWGLSHDDGMRAAKNALFAVVFGPQCGGKLPTDSLRRMILEQAPAAEIAEKLSKGGDESSELKDCARNAGMDPLLLVAVRRPRLLPLILQQQPEVDVRNKIGKTALMQAAQFDQLQSVSFLLAHGAKVNATTWAGEDLVSNIVLGDDGRTPLMYAAAHGSLKLIALLLHAGADPWQADTKGHRALDYLLGDGPTPANAGLRGAERARAIRLLY